MKEALYYSVQGDKIQCQLCPHNCLIGPERSGICRQRRNINGLLYALNYGRAASTNLDPIEKKPLYHFHPATQIMSFGTVGCNLGCQFCQNWSISHEDAETEALKPEDAVDIAQKYKSPAIAYTYNEPFIWYEFVLETAMLARAEGIKNVLVTNGYVNPEPLAEILPYIDAMNIDLKSIRPEFYRKLCQAKLEPVLETLRAVTRSSSKASYGEVIPEGADRDKAAHKRVHIEVTNLVIPGENDALEQFEELSRWVAENLGQDTPLHFSAYHPAYHMDNPATPASTLVKAYEIARKHLWFVYTGNVVLEKGNDTICHNCQTRLINRRGYLTKILALTPQGRCSNCGAENNIVL
ncbi:MAG: AmmeMemoRadiSam system radical SAM enzyme [Planctomycetota bacterium]